MGILLFWALANFKAASWRKYYHQQGFFEILFHIVYEINNIIMSTEDKAKWNQHSVFRTYQKQDSMGLR